MLAYSEQSCRTKIKKKISSSMINVHIDLLSTTIPCGKSTNSPTSDKDQEESNTNTHASRYEL